jgi:hypothetical protein
MKKIIPFLISIILILNCNAHIASDPCNFKFVLSDDAGFGWPSTVGIVITVDGVDYGFVNLPLGTANAEVIVALPSGEVQLCWTGGFVLYHFEVYNSLNELIYTSPEDLGGWFFTYQNECPSDTECLPITDFEGVYNQEKQQANLNWKAPETAVLIGFDIFRNDSLLAHVAPDTIFYTDNTAELESGIYKYCVVPVYPFECNLDEKCVEVPINVGIEDYEDNIKIYPNPASDIINITGADIANIKIFNSMGQLISNQNHKNEINVSEFQNGIYLFSVEVSTGHIIQKKIIINH